jgi:hypothetical protein
MATCGGHTQAVLLELRENETATAFELNVTLRQGAQEGAIRVKILCTGHDSPCKAPVAQGEGTGSFHLAGTINLPPRTLFMLTAEPLDSRPDLLGLGGAYVDVTGSVTVQARRHALAPNERLPVQVHGIAGACAPLAEPTCNSLSGTTNYTIKGTLRQIKLNATWTPLSSASRTMRLHIACTLPSFASCPGKADFKVEGSGPLHLDSSYPTLPMGANLDITLEFTTPQGAPARQPFTLEGHIDSSPRVPEG